MEKHEIPANAIVLDERNGRFQIDQPEPCQTCNGTKIVYDEWFHDRNYNAFAILGDVRNGVAFAGVSTGSGYNAISSDRGLPSDLSQEILDHLERLGEVVVEGRVIQRASDTDDDSVYDELEKTKEGYWGLGDHSWSHVFLTELVDYNWDQVTVREGWVDPWNFELWRTQGKPATWSGGISGAMIEHLSNRAMAHLIDSGDLVFEDVEDEDQYRDRPYSTALGRQMADWGLPEGSNGWIISRAGRERPVHYTNVEWEETYRSSVGTKIFDVISQLAAIAPDGDTDRIRLVFGFDS